MILKEKLEAWEKIYQEVKHPYTKKNRSFLLFRIGLSLLMLCLTILVLMDILEIVAKSFATFSYMTPLTLVRLQFWLALLLLGMVLIFLGIHYRKKW